MDTNFFTQIAQLEITGHLNFSISKTGHDQMIVSLLLQNNTCEDDAKNIIPPLTLKGTSKELDNGFFEQIKTPIENASGLMVNMEAFMKQLEEAKKRSAMEKETADKAKKEKEEKEKKYTEALKKAENLEIEGKFKEAWSALPKASEYPDVAEFIRSKQDQYEKEFAPNLFTES